MRLHTQCVEQMPSGCPQHRLTPAQRDAANKDTKRNLTAARFKFRTEPLHSFQLHMASSPDKSKPGTRLMWYCTVCIGPPPVYTAYATAAPADSQCRISSCLRMNSLSGRHGTCGFPVTISTELPTPNPSPQTLPLTISAARRQLSPPTIAYGHRGRSRTFTRAAASPSPPAPAPPCIQPVIFISA